MQFLSWRKVGANHHELCALDGTVWADVQPHKGTAEWPARQGQMIAIVRLPDFHLKGGIEHWSLADGVPAAKSQIERWIERNRCATENFDVVPAAKAIVLAAEHEAFVARVCSAALAA